MKKIKKQNGFTLVEVMVVIAIIGILSAVAGVNFFTKIKQDRLSGAARELGQFVNTSEQKTRLVAGSYSVGIKENDNKVVFYQSATCDSLPLDSISLHEQVQAVVGTKGTTACANNNNWAKNGSSIYCLSYDQTATLHPAPTGCFALEYIGETMTSGVIKVDTLNYVQSWLKIGSSERWL